jgi:hypothetical protein
METVIPLLATLSVMPAVNSYGSSNINNSAFAICAISNDVVVQHIRRTWPSTFTHSVFNVLQYRCINLI